MHRCIRIDGPHADGSTPLDGLNRNRSTGGYHRADKQFHQLVGTASRLGPPMGLYEGCQKGAMRDGGTARVCIDPAPDTEDSWLVAIELTGN
jgi:hypothetical protein